MKAWIVQQPDEFCCSVVFAETCGKAKLQALSTDACESARFTDLTIHRASKLDCYYKTGKDAMDWNDPNDRLALVKNYGFHCEYLEPDECEYCSARNDCSLWEDEMEDME